MSGGPSPADRVTVSTCPCRSQPPNSLRSLSLTTLSCTLGDGGNSTHFKMLCTARRVAAHQLRATIAQPTTSRVAFFSPAALRRLASTLAVLEQKEGKLNHGSLSAITAAQKVGGPVHGFLAGSNIKPVADEAATADGVEKIIAVDNSAYDKVYTPTPTLNAHEKELSRIILQHC